LRPRRRGKGKGGDKGIATSDLVFISFVSVKTIKYVA
jgi:hypothetical protein